MYPAVDSLPPGAWQRILLVRSAEEVDTACRHLSREQRAAAGREALAVLDDAGFLRLRAELLLPSLPPEAQVHPRQAWWQRWPWLVWSMVPAALLLGWLTNELGPERQINVLSFPLLLLILWNLIVAVLALVGHFRASRGRGAQLPAAHRTAAGFASDTAATAEARIAVWERPARVARAALVFHAAAIALAVGIVSGMYARALVREYSVTMESTFLQKPQVVALTRILLGPASTVTGIPVPGPGGSAAPWIHLWAASAGLFVIIPRLLLMNMARQRLQNPTAGRSEYIADWARRARAEAGGASLLVEVLPVHQDAGKSTRDMLGNLLVRQWGPGTEARYLPAVTYGQESMAADHLAAGSSHLVLLFSLSATPEAAIHGEFIRAVRQRLPDTQCLIVLDALGYAQRFQSLPEYPRMIADRQQAWQNAAAGQIPITVLEPPLA